MTQRRQAWRVQKMALGKELVAQFLEHSHTQFVRDRSIKLTHARLLKLYFVKILRKGVSGSDEVIWVIALGNGDCVPKYIQFNDLNKKHARNIILYFCLRLGIFLKSLDSQTKRARPQLRLFENGITNQSAAACDT